MERSYTFCFGRRDFDAVTPSTVQGMSSYLDKFFQLSNNIEKIKGNLVTQKDNTIIPTNNNIDFKIIVD